MTLRATALKHLYIPALCLAGLVVLAAVTLGRDMVVQRRLEAEYAAAMDLMRRQELFAPLLAEIHKHTPATDTREPLAEDRFLSEDEYEQALARIALQCGLQQTDIMPDIQSILSDDKLLRMRISTRGPSENTRRLLLALSRRPFVAGIDGFGIRQADAGGDFALTLQLALGTPPSADNTDEAE